MTPPGDSTCWTTTRAIVETEQIVLLADEAEDLLAEKRTYVLCNDTTYRFGKYDKDVFGQKEDEDELQWPLVVFNPNLHILCGSNCTFDVGSENAYIVYAPRKEEIDELDGDLVPTAHNLLLEGITFTNSESFGRSYIILMGAPADGVTIKDCTFKSLSGSLGAIVLLFNDDGTGGGDGPYQSVLVQDSVFADSVFDASTAIITGHYAEPGTIPDEESWPLTLLHIARSKFTSLVNGEGANNEDSIIHMAPYSRLVVSDSCFTDNKSRSGTVIRTNTGDFTSLNNFGLSNLQLEMDEGFPENCVGAISLDEESDNLGLCEDFDSQACAVDMALTLAPEEMTEEPAETTSPTVSMAPTKTATPTSALGNETMAPSMSPSMAPSVVGATTSPTSSLTSSPAEASPTTPTPQITLAPTSGSFAATATSTVAVVFATLTTLCYLA
eukprot:CAMPEP_0194033684 /NCGR_PEP_ID=MMETSP0009_2-20130614/6271_1 /TAXON_ID=210454 /ORGANISM="Grammatophora oceanica, Strain CCMP 410" /LENGTH=440 /DNA_ID=CAMNT_0038674401 /DNA_START=8 /DNA_END=1330 /DNA_ORIENTATION=-